MNAEIFAEWLHRQGHRVIRTGSSYWVEVAARVYQACPYHWLLTPPPAELADLFKQTQAIGARYSTPLNTPVGIVSYHVVYQEPVYELDQLPKKARYDVRTALKHGSVEPISLARLAADGWAVRQSTLARQGRIEAETEPWWRKLCLSAEGLPGFEAWGAIVAGQLAAALLAFTCDNCCSILYQQSRTEFLKLGVNNALTYEFTRQALERPGITSIFYGLHSLDAPASVDDYKFRMNFVARPVRQRVVFHPWLAPLFNPATHALVRQVRRWSPQNYTMAKAEGLMRFYLAGQRPLHEQPWPECLHEVRASLTG